MREPHDAALDAPDAKRRRGADGSPSSSEDPDWTHVLVYNVSLSDVVLAAPYRDAAAAHRFDGFDGAVHDGRPLSHAASSCAVAPEDPAGYPGAREAVARPHFSSTAKVAGAIDAELESRGYRAVARWPRDDGGPGTTPRARPPIGFEFHSANLPLGDGPDDFEWHPERSGGEPPPARPAFAEVYFPLLAVILPRWIHGFADDDASARSGDKNAGAGATNATNDDPNNGGPRRSSFGTSSQQPKIRRVVHLVSGYGAPRDRSHAPESNSTEATARIMKRFVEAAYPGQIVVRLAHSGNGVFRYGANARFVDRRLRPAVARERDAAARRWGEEWRWRFKLTVALCDGTPARLQALMGAFRDMRPYLLHVWQLKNFWRGLGPLRDADVDIQRFHRAEATPPVAVADVASALGWHEGMPAEESAEVRADAAIATRIVEEMKKHRDAFVASAAAVDASGAPAHELGTFWLRKTRKPVLAVLCVRERARRKSPDDSDRADFADSAADAYSFHRGVNLEVSMPTGSLCSERNAIGNALAANPSLRRADMFGIAILSLGAEDVNGAGAGGAPGRGAGVSRGSGGMSRDPSAADFSVAGLLGGGGGVCGEVAAGAGGGGPGGSNGGDSRGPQNAAGVGRVDAAAVSRGLNPLKPCGACVEWLNKIAEVNPGFKVIMFTDVTCEEVYVKNVAQC